MTSLILAERLSWAATAAQGIDSGDGQSKRQLNALSVISPTMTVPVDQALLPVGRAGPAFASI